MGRTSVPSLSERLGEKSKLPKRNLIAVVDDDGSMREAVTGLLKSFGYDAVAFERPEDFLSSSQRRRVSAARPDRSG